MLVLFLSPSIRLPSLLLHAATLSRMTTCLSNLTCLWSCDCDIYICIYIYIKLFKLSGNNDLNKIVTSFKQHFFNVGIATSCSLMSYFSNKCFYNVLKTSSENSFKIFVEIPSKKVYLPSILLKI